MIIRCKKKPIVHEAIQFTGSASNISLLRKWSNHQCWSEGKILKVKCLEALAVLERGGYVVMGIKGEVWPVREDIFKLTYEEAP